MIKTISFSSSVAVAYQNAQLSSKSAIQSSTFSICCDSFSNNNPGLQFIVQFCTLFIFYDSCLDPKPNFFYIYGWLIKKYGCFSAKPYFFGSFMAAVKNRASQLKFG